MRKTAVGPSRCCVSDGSRAFRRPLSPRSYWQKDGLKLFASVLKPTAAGARRLGVAGMPTLLAAGQLLEEDATLLRVARMIRRPGHMRLPVEDIGLERVVEGVTADLAGDQAERHRQRPALDVGDEVGGFALGDADGGHAHRREPGGKLKRNGVLAGADLGRVGNEVDEPLRLPSLRHPGEVGANAVALVNRMAPGAGLEIKGL